MARSFVLLRYLSNKHAEHGRVEATETVACKLHRQVVASVILERLARKGHQLSTPSGEETTAAFG